MSQPNKNKLRFTHHALRRGLERMLKIEAPYTLEQLINMKKLLLKTMEWDSFNVRWVIHDYKLRFIVHDGHVVTILPYDHTPRQLPISKFAKKFSKKLERMGTRRNMKATERKGKYDGKD